MARKMSKGGAPDTTTSYPGKYTQQKTTIRPKAGSGPMTPGTTGNQGVASRVGRK